MAGGFAVSKSGADRREFKGKITWYVWICGIIAATSGLMFGYDIGISDPVRSSSRSDDMDRWSSRSDLTNVAVQCMHMQVE